MKAYTGRLNFVMVDEDTGEEVSRYVGTITVPEAETCEAAGARIVAGANKILAPNERRFWKATGLKVKPPKLEPTPTTKKTVARRRA
jgi:hypothetical protein